jgi:pimeloyl-ACP methyl ester carboxylesterase
MTRIVRHIRWIMVISGALTATIYAAFAPDAALRSTFGETLEGPLAHLVVRNWGALIALVGAMLIYGAFDPHVRSLVLIVAAISKALFIRLVIAQGDRYLDQQAGIAVAIDGVMVLLFAWYLVAARRPRQAALRTTL